MIKTKVVQRLKCLRPAEVKEFTTYLKAQCPAYERQVVHLYEYLVKYYPKFDNERRLEHLAIYKKVYPDRLAKKGTPQAKEDINRLKQDLSRAANRLSDYLQQYFIKKELEYDPVLQNLILLKRYQEFDTNPVFKDVIKNARELAKPDAKTFFEMIYQSEVAALDLKYRVTQEDRQEIMKEVVRRAGNFNLFVQLKYQLLLLKQQKEKDDFEVSPFVLNLANLEKNSENLLTRIYAQTALVVLNDNSPVEELKNVVETLKHSHTAIGVLETENIFNLLINHTNDLWRKGVQQSGEIMLDLYLFGLSTGILLSNNILPKLYFRNIVFLAIRLEKFKFTENFIKENVDKLNPEIRESEALLCKARMYASEGKHNEAIKCAIQDVFTSVDDQIVVNQILNVSYYELGDYDLLERQLDKFNYFIKRRKELKGEKGRPYLNFVKFMRLFIKLKVTKKYGKSYLLEKYHSLQPMESWNWVEKKLERIR